MVDAADKDGTGLLTEKEFIESSAKEVNIIKNYAIEYYRNHIIKT